MKLSAVRMGADIASFIATPNAAQTIPNEVWTKINFGTASLNDSSLFNTSLSRWTPPAGKVQVSAAIYYTAGLYIGTPVFLGVYKNGTLFRHNPSACVSNVQAGATINIIDVCNGTDYYEINSHIFTASNATVETSGGGTFFMGTQL